MNITKKITINLPKTEQIKLLYENAITHTSAILTLSSPIDEVFDFLQINKLIN